MVKQLEEGMQLEVWMRSWDGDYLGDMPCLFGTLASQRYRWDEVIRLIVEEEGIGDQADLSRHESSELVNKYPLLVAWYDVVCLELALNTIVVPLFGASAYVAVFVE